MKRFAALALAAVMAAGLAGCGSSGTLKSMEWAIEPAGEFEAVEPVADTATVAAGMVSNRPGEAGYYLAKTAAGWGVLNAASGDVAASAAFVAQPVRCGAGHLYDAGLYEGERWYDWETLEELDAQLEGIGTNYRMEVGHGGGSNRFLADGAGAVSAVSFGEASMNQRPLAEIEGLPGLIPVQQGTLRSDWTGEDPATWEDFILEHDGLFAVATSEGRLLTDFVYEAACMGTDEAIAVCKEGKWGYVDTAGKEIVPCEYDAFWGVRWAWNSETEKNEPTTGIYPAPFTEGCVVVKQNGQTGVLKADGSWLLKMGEAEDAAPAFGGLLWVKTEGKWGAVKLPS